MSATDSVKHHPAFDFLRSQYVSSLNLTVQEFEHRATGARHYHLAADSPENVFMVALRTVPEDSTGVAHILEHTALCGSKRYPVRDPFFMMTRRSLNTFMNALTSSDWTAYPFASLNRKDYNNLLDVYLDAVFFSRLDPLDFAQEGHRLEFEKGDDPNSPLMYKGVVYNEMKGAMSSVPAQLWQAMSKYLFPTSTYHHNSGGEPDCIPDLTYEQLLDFYRTHYHPSNAIFMTFGDIPADELQEKFENQALSQFERLDKHIEVTDEKRYYAPLRVQEFYPYGQEDTEYKHHVVMGWLLGKSTNLKEALQAQLLVSVLLDNSASPLLHALESTDLGSSPSPLCGLDDSQKELSFMCGLEGCSEAAVRDIEALILSTLERVAEEGIPIEDVEAALHQLELHQREIGGDSFPYGLQLALTALSAATHRGDPVQLLDIDAALAQLREDIETPGFIQNLTRRLLLDNCHRVTLTLSPDNQMLARKEDAEKQKLAQIKNELDDEQTQQIVDLAQALEKRQHQEDDESILPKVTLEDVPAREQSAEGERTQLAKADGTAAFPLTRYDAGTNGLCYQQIIYRLPALTETLTPLLPIFSQCVTELGTGDKDYLAAQRWQAGVAGSLSAFSSVRTGADDLTKISAWYAFSGKALNRNQPALCDLLAAYIEQPRFDEYSRINEIVAQIRAHREQSVTGSGHGLAMAAASAGISPLAQLNHHWSGLESIRLIKRIDEQLKTDKGREDLAADFLALHEQITRAPRQALLIAEGDQLDRMQDVLAQRFADHIPTQSDDFSVHFREQTKREAWLTNTQVNFCAKAFPTVPSDHEDAAALVVLGGVLRNGFLHRAVREQGGAYGGGASQDSVTGTFRFFSYRDPRLSDTLDDFDRSLDWLLTNNHPWQKVEESILGAISALDRSESPSGQAKRCFYQELHGRDQEVRQRFRERILATREEDLKKVAEKYLSPDKAHTAVVTDYSRREQVEKMNLTCEEL